ncbi:MAG: hypothetical protein C6I00_06575 [Nitratiruptor sp.]|nr:hypothetical protein [Nitratiruptor sp.]NPA83108.1 DUF2202 domain-containing protein [Campylobacterota bacterium]
MKKFVGSVVAVVSLFGATASPQYLQELQEFLTSKPFPVQGAFYAYDFEHDGKIDYNDWLYLVLPDQQQAYRLLASEPNPANHFGFAPVPVPADLKPEPDGYFVKLDFPADPSSAFSWVYITNTPQGYVFKLMGATPEGHFDYLDIDGDGRFDPLPVRGSVSNDSSLPGVSGYVATFIPQEEAQEMENQGETAQEILNGLTPEQRYEVAYMYNEEKLAHDLYLALYERFSDESLAKPLLNIGEGSETRHMEAVLGLGQKYDVNLSEEYMSPYDPELVTSLGDGEFAIGAIQALYDELYAKGSQSLQDALEVGCIVEVTDVVDLNKALEVAKDNDDLTRVFTFLRQGSYNHYWAFDNALKQLGVAEGCCALGEEFCKSPEEFPASNRGAQGGGGGKGHGPKWR